MGVVVRAIHRSELAQCLDLWCAVWPGDRRAYFERYFYGDLDFQPEYTRVAVADGRVVSAVHIVKRVVSCGDFTLTMGGIANVATLPEWRRRGLNIECLRQAVAIMEADAMDFSLLFTGIHDYYARADYAGVASHQLVGTLSDTPRSDPSHYSVRPYAAGDFGAVRRIYAAYNATRPVAVRRSAPYWRDWVGFWLDGRNGPSARAYVSESSGMVAAYAFADLGPVEDGGSGTARIVELGAASGADAALAPLLDAVAGDARAAGLARVVLPLATDTVVQREAHRFLTGATLQRETSGMVRLLHRENLLRGLAPELNARWMAAGRPSGSLTFSTPYGSVRIGSSAAFLEIAAVSEPQPTLSQSELFQLLFGSGLESCTSTPEADTFARALFPRYHSWYWELDGF